MLPTLAAYAIVLLPLEVFAVISLWLGWREYRRETRRPSRGFAVVTSAPNSPQPPRNGG